MLSCTVTLCVWAGLGKDIRILSTARKVPCSKRNTDLARALSLTSIVAVAPALSEKWAVPRMSRLECAFPPVLPSLPVNVTLPRQRAVPLQASLTFATPRPFVVMSVPTTLMVDAPEVIKLNSGPPCNGAGSERGAWRGGFAHRAARGLHRAAFGARDRACDSKRFAGRVDLERASVEEQQDFIQVQCNAVIERRQLSACKDQRSRARIDCDRRPHDLRAEFEWTRVQGQHDRQALRGATVRSGQIDRTVQRGRVGSQADG